MGIEQQTQKQKDIIWNNSLIGNPIHMAGAAFFALFSAGILTAYSISRLCQNLKKTDPKPK